MINQRPEYPILDAIKCQKKHYPVTSTYGNRFGTQSLAPFFDIVQRGLASHVDGDHYFDTIADNAVFEFRYIFPGWPQKLDSREALINLARSENGHYFLLALSWSMWTSGGAPLLVEMQLVLRAGFQRHENVRERRIAAFAPAGL